MIPIVGVSRVLAIGRRCRLQAVATKRTIQAAAAAAPPQQYSHAEPSPDLLAEAKHLMGTQHGHKNGPWLSMTAAVQAHYDDHCKKKNNNNGSNEYKVLDLACGPRGEPATTIAHAIPNARVHCTDLCEITIASVPVVTETNSNAHGTDSSVPHDPNSTPPPPNLTKSIASLTDLSCFPSDSFHVITCSYGYNLIDDSEFEPALKEAYRVLAPGGVLIVANWESSALHLIGRDVLNGVQRGYTSYDDGDDDNDALFLPCMAKPALEPISLSSGTQSAIFFQEAMERVGFRMDPVPLVRSYPFRLGRLPALQFFLGTSTVREKLLKLGALTVDEYAAGGWSCLAEQIFFSNIRKYTVPDKNLKSSEGQVDGIVDNDATMLWLHGNTYKMSIMRK